MIFLTPLKGKSNYNQPDLNSTFSFSFTTHPVYTSNGAPPARSGAHCQSQRRHCTKNLQRKTKTKSTNADDLFDSTQVQNKISSLPRFPCFLLHLKYLPKFFRNDFLVRLQPPFDLSAGSSTRRNVLFLLRVCRGKLREIAVRIKSEISLK